MTVEIEIRITHNGTLYSQKVQVEHEAMVRTIFSVKERLQQVFDETVQRIENRMGVSFNQQPGSIL